MQILDGGANLCYNLALTSHQPGSSHLFVPARLVQTIESVISIFLGYLHQLHTRHCVLAAPHNCHRSASRVSFRGS